jgi:glycosyltransferase involved in cell wall biosynthesis
MAQKMRLGIDVSPLVASQRTGVQTYILNAMKGLAKVDTENEYFLYSNRDFDNPIENDRWHKRIGSGLPAKIAICWLQTQLKQLVAEDDIDLFWGAYHFLPLFLDRSVKSVLTIYDLVYRFYPGTLTARNVWSHRVFTERSIRKADKIIAISESTANDLKRVFNISDRKIQVIAPGVDLDFFRPYPTESARKYLTQKYGILESYVLCVGTIEPRKNLATLFRAYAQLCKRSRVAHQLVVAGARGWKNSHLFTLVSKLNIEDRVRFLGYVPDEDLPKLYCGADIFVYPSIHEGFGLPVLEAMACGCPAVAFDNSSLPEDGGNAGLLVETNNISELSISIEKVLFDENLRDSMAERGIERAKMFGQRGCSERVYELFQTV